MRLQHLSILLLLFCILHASDTLSAENKKDTILQRLFLFSKTITHTPPVPSDSLTYAYMKSVLHIKKRNIFLMGIPTLYQMARARDRQYIEESYNQVKFDTKQRYTIQKLCSVSSNAVQRISFPAMQHYITPNIYGVTMFHQNILSPFNRQNKIYYRYATKHISDTLAHLHFTPRLHNTLLVKGSAVLNPVTGRIYDINLSGEYDMIFFRLTINMHQQSAPTVIPRECKLYARFSSFGNDIRTHYHVVYHLPKIQYSSTNHTNNTHNDTTIINLIRPSTLSLYEQSIYQQTTKTNKQTIVNTDTARQTKWQQQKEKLKYIFWDNFGDKVLNDMKQYFGSKQQGYLHIDPILNPFYMEYSAQHGLYYNLNIQGGYQFTKNSDIWMQLRGGYSFMRKQFSYYIPLVYTFNKKHNGNISAVISGGRRIQNTALLNELKVATHNNKVWDQLNLYEFNDTYYNCYGNYEFSKKIGVQLGVVYHQRRALHPAHFLLINKPTTYTAVSPKIQINYRPWAYQGPTLTVNYEKSINKLIGNNIPYTRWEFDAQYIMPLHYVKSLSMRWGIGFYTYRTHNDYFVDFENFRQTFLPMGWNDDWSGNFELLDSKLYNQSNYYHRVNVTYESPFLLVVWVPLLGRYIECERLYFSALQVKQAHPYIELGYALKTRLLSIGAFLSTINGKYKDFGVKFGFELFRKW